MKPNAVMCQDGSVRMLTAVQEGDLIIIDCTPTVDYDTGEKRRMVEMEYKKPNIPALKGDALLEIVGIMNRIDAMINAELFDELIDASCPDDYDGEFSMEGAFRFEYVQFVTHEKLFLEGWLGK